MTRGFAAALEWARGLGDERVWALEDCRHVSGAFERFLLVHGERVVRVATRLMAGERRGGRDRGKSDRIDALAVARAALREGARAAAGRRAGRRRARHPAAGRSPRTARPDAHRALQRPALASARPLARADASRAARCCRRSGRRTIARRLARAEQTARVRIARDELRHLRELSHTIDALEAEIAELVAQVAPQLLAEPGFGPLTAGKLIGEIAGAQRFATDAKLARAGGIAPIPVSSGNTNRHRLDRGGNRQINTAIHRVAITRAALPPRDPRLHRPQTRRRQEHHRGHPLPQAPPRPPHLAPPPAAPPRPDTLTHQSLDIGAAKAASATETPAASRL